MDRRGRSSSSSSCKGTGFSYSHVPMALRLKAREEIDFQSTFKDTDEEQQALLRRMLGSCICTCGEDGHSLADCAAEICSFNHRIYGRPAETSVLFRNRFYLERPKSGHIAVFRVEGILISCTESEDPDLLARKCDDLYGTVSYTYNHQGPDAVPVVLFDRQPGSRKRAVNTCIAFPDWTGVSLMISGPSPPYSCFLTPFIFEVDLHWEDVDDASGEPIRVDIKGKTVIGEHFEPSDNLLEDQLGLGKEGGRLHIFYSYISNAIYLRFGARIKFTIPKQCRVYGAIVLSEVGDPNEIYLFRNSRETFECIENSGDTLELSRDSVLMRRGAPLSLYVLLFHCKDPDKSFKSYAEENLIACSVSFFTPLSQGDDADRESKKLKVGDCPFSLELFMGVLDPSYPSCEY